MKIAIAKGDGIGPEIMDSVLRIFHVAQVPLEYQIIEMGKPVYDAGYKSGMTPEAQAIVEQLSLLFKGPMETPKGKGNRSINVTARKMWSTYANVRRFRTLTGVNTLFSQAGIHVDLTIIRENLEDTYSGVEHQITPDIAVCRKFTSAPESYRIHKFAFEYAVKNNMKKVTCGNKANIMKLTDGMFLDIFYEVAKDYPNIESNDVIVDDLCMKLVTNPAQFQVMVLPNLQGDIVSDLCAGLVGGLGFAPSANVGDDISIYEAVHGTAPDIVGKNKANPVALLLSGVMMLKSLGLFDFAKNIETALFTTLNEGIHTPDLAGGTPVNTHEFTEAIISRLPVQSQRAVFYKVPKKHPISSHSRMYTKNHAKEICVGVDISVESTDLPETLVHAVKQVLQGTSFALDVLTNRGANVYPGGSKYTECVDGYTFRIIAEKDTTLQAIMQLATVLSNTFHVTGLDILKTYDGRKGYAQL